MTFLTLRKKKKNYEAILTAVDFEKVFDSLNLNFLFNSSEAFGLLHGLRLFTRIYLVVFLTMVLPHLISN